MVTVYDRHGATIRRSINLRGLLTHYRAYPDDLVVKVIENPISAGDYNVTFFFARGETCLTHWADWRVLLDWIRARRSWSVNRVTFDAPLYDRIDAIERDRFTAFRKSGILLTRHTYAS